MPTFADSSIAVLCSGGLDSGILLDELLATHTAVFPLYVRCGLAWEQTELDHLHRFLGALDCPGLRSLSVLELPVRDVYGDHWSLTGDQAPGGETAPEAVFLPGRNVLLLSKALLWCHLRDVPAIALGVLRSNPFPDATSDFFAAYQKVVNRAVNADVEVLLPYAGLSKADVMVHGSHLPFEFTFSCINPHENRHCGNCNKCHERRQAFAAAQLADPTEYVQTSHCGP